MPFMPDVTMATVAAIIQKAGSVMIARAEIGAFASSSRDSWLGSDVPLGENEERYAVRIYDGETVILATEVTEPALTLDAATVTTLGLGASVDVEIAQVSLAVGEGIPARRMLSLP